MSEAGYRSGEFDPGEFGALQARVKAVEDEVKHARADRAKLFQAVNSVASNQAVLGEKLDRNHETLVKFATQCGACKIDMNNMQADVNSLKQGTGTTAIRRKSQPRGTSALEKKLWHKPLGEWLFDILAGALKVVGIAAVVALILYGVGNTQI